MPNPQPDGYLAVPPTKADRAVLVLHAWWGLNDTMRAFCDRLAASGFVAFAPDLYSGKVTDQIAEAEKLSDALDPDLAKEVIADAAQFLIEQFAPENGSLAVIGFSLGAYFALDLSITDPEVIHTVVVFYGTRPGEYGRSKAAYLGHFAENDAFEPQSDVDDLETALKHAGCPVSFYHYQGTGHWFFESDRVQAYNQAAANLAWDRTINFLRHSR